MVTREGECDGVKEAEQKILKCHGKSISERFAALSRITAFNFLPIYKGQETERNT